MISPGLGLCTKFRGNPEEKSGKVLEKEEGEVVVREGFLEEVPPEFKSWKYD